MASRQAKTIPVVLFGHYDSRGGTTAVVIPQDPENAEPFTKEAIEVACKKYIEMYAWEEYGPEWARETCMEDLLGVAWLAHDRDLMGVDGEDLDTCGWTLNPDKSTKATIVVIRSPWLPGVATTLDEILLTLDSGVESENAGILELVEFDHVPTEGEWNEWNLEKGDMEGGGFPYLGPGADWVDGEVKVHPRWDDDAMSFCLVWTAEACLQEARARDLSVK